MREPYVLELKDGFRLYCPECNSGAGRADLKYTITKDHPYTRWYEKSTEYEDGTVNIINDTFPKDKTIPMPQTDPFPLFYVAPATWQTVVNASAKIAVKAKAVTKYRSIEKFICPNCGAAYDAKSVVMLNYKTWTPFFISCGVFDDGDCVTLKLNYKYVKPAMDNLVIKIVNERMIFNTRTGQTYLMAPWSNGKMLNGYKGRRCTNISYFNGLGDSNGIYSVPDEKKKQLYELIKAKLQARFGERVQTLEDHYFEMMLLGNQVTDPYSIMDITSYNRMPSMERNRWQELVNTTRNNKGKVAKVIQKLRYTEDPVQHLLDAYKIDNMPDKTRDIIRKEPKLFYRYLMGSLMLDDPEKIHDFMMDRHIDYPFYTVKYKKQFREFFDDIAKEHGEDKAISFILRSYSYYFNPIEVAKRYRKIREKGAVIDMKKQGNVIVNAIDTVYNALYPKPPKDEAAEDLERDELGVPF